MREEYTWSLVDPKPILVYLEHYDAYIVYWNGIVMTHNQALCLAMEISCGNYITPEMKKKLQENFLKLYYSNAFGRRDWDDIIECYSYSYDFQKKKLIEHVKSLIKDMLPSDVLSWFDYKNARSSKVV